MNAGDKYIRNGVGAVRPYVYGTLDLIDFVRETFGAVELERNKIENGFHVQVQIGDSTLVLSAMTPVYSEATRASIYVYVTDVDSTYQRAVAFGATSVAKPAQRPFQERTAAVDDSFGNRWYLATFNGSEES